MTATQKTRPDEGPGGFCALGVILHKKQGHIKIIGTEVFIAVR